MSSTRNSNVILNKYFVDISKKFKLMTEEIETLKLRVGELENELANQSINQNDNVVNDIRDELTDKFTNYMEQTIESPMSNTDNLILSSDLKKTKESKGFKKREINQSIQLDKAWLTKF